MININDRTIHEQLKYNISNDERSSHEYFFIMMEPYSQRINWCIGHTKHEVDISFQVFRKVFLGLLCFKNRS